MSAPTTDRLDTITADDVVEVQSREGTTFVEVWLAIDTGDERVSTMLSADQARRLGEALVAHAAGQRAVRHGVGCYVENVNNSAGDTFWVCKPGCAAAGWEGDS